MANLSDVLNFWFSPPVEPLWFDSTPEFDLELRNRFEPVFLSAINGELSEWASSADGSLALVIVLDQFPLNMYRHTARSFSSGPLAVSAAKDAIAKGFDKQLTRDRVAFLYLPLMHSEELEDQELSVGLFEAMNLKSNLRFALHHQELIKRFGRFPHRNGVLGRTSTPEEIAYLNSPEAFLG